MVAVLVHKGPCFPYPSFISPYLFCCFKSVTKTWLTQSVWKVPLDALTSSLLSACSFSIQSPSSRAELLLCTPRRDSREVSLALQLFWLMLRSLQGWAGNSCKCALHKWLLPTIKTYSCSSQCLWHPSVSGGQHGGSGQGCPRAPGKACSMERTGRETENRR